VVLEHAPVPARETDVDVAGWHEQADSYVSAGGDLPDGWVRTEKIVSGVAYDQISKGRRQFKVMTEKSRWENSASRCSPVHKFLIADLVRGPQRVILSVKK
jgi:hypothetical protein